MKKILGITAVAIALALHAAVPNGNIQLAWDYPTNELSTNLTFIIYSTTNLSIPMTSWPMLTNVVGTNLSVKVTITPGAQYFTCAASNFWSQSDFSNVALTPPLPKTNTLGIQKLP